MNTLFYIHDPMCSWCWAFENAKTSLFTQLPSDIKVTHLLGGLAPDTDKLMPTQQQKQIQQAWKNIEQLLPDVKFNFDFWKNNQARRSTYPACRAVIAAQQQAPNLGIEMTSAIQTAYYQQAMNPSDDHTLIKLAEKLNLDLERFTISLNLEKTQQLLLSEIKQSHQLKALSFPSLVFQVESTYWPVTIDYKNAVPMLETIEKLKG